MDEFQDTNSLQFEILALLIEGHPEVEKRREPLPIYFFGDKDQAIYEFIGATPENVDKGALRFRCQVFTLEQNHRTDSRKILELSSALRSDIETLSSTHPATLYVTRDEQSEASAIRKEIETLAWPLHHICVIAPTHYRLEQIQKALSEPDPIPFVFIPDFSGSTLEEKFAALFIGLRSLSFNSDTSLTKEIKSALDELSDESKRDIMELMLNMAREYDLRFRDMSISARARDFLNHILLEVNWGHLVRQKVHDKVYVSTVHGVKGLEFDHVIICGLENYSLPHSSVCVKHCNHGEARSQIDDLVSEAKRLLYVGITRSVNDISFYTIRTNPKGKQRRVTCLMHPLLSHIQSDQGTIDICGH